MTLPIPSLIAHQPGRFPAPMVDVLSAPSPDCVTGAKAVSASEEYFQGHFPGMPLMPGVLMLEAATQAATALLAGGGNVSGGASVGLRGVDDAKFRRHVVPGDRVDVEVRLTKRRGPVARVQATLSVAGTVVMEAQLVLVVAEGVDIHPSAIVHPGAAIGTGTVVGPGAVIGPHVVLGRHVRVGASAVIDGHTTIGDRTQIFPFASIGLPPQDLKYRGEPTRLVVGTSNIFRECVTIHRGTVGGGGETRIGDCNLFMAYAHVAHDCQVGSHTIFGPGATLGGHVAVGDYAQISAYSGIHQFCRVGRDAFIGGYSVVTKDALPFAKTVGSRSNAKVYGANTIGLIRRGYTPEVLRRLKGAYRLLLTSKLRPAKALEAIESDPVLRCAEVDHLVSFIKSSVRGVTLGRVSRRLDESDD